MDLLVYENQKLRYQIEELKTKRKDDNQQNQLKEHEGEAKRLRARIATLEKELELEREANKIHTKIISSTTEDFEGLEKAVHTSIKVIEATIEEIGSTPPVRGDDVTSNLLHAVNVLATLVLNKHNSTAISNSDLIKKLSRLVSQCSGEEARSHSVTLDQVIDNLSAAITQLQILLDGKSARNKELQQTIKLLFSQHREMARIKEEGHAGDLQQRSKLKTPEKRRLSPATEPPREKEEIKKERVEKTRVKKEPTPAVVETPRGRRGKRGSGEPAEGYWELI